MNRNRILSYAMAMALSFAVADAAAVAISSGTPTPGQWNASFTATKAAADAAGKPMLLMWAKASCPMCNKMKDAMGRADFLEWQSRQNIYMAITHSSSSDNRDALSLIWSARTLNNLPLFCVYWKRPDGSKYVYSFVGRDRDSTLLVKTGSLGMQLAGTVDAALAQSGWTDSSSGGETPAPPSPPTPPTPSEGKTDPAEAVAQFVRGMTSSSFVKLPGAVVDGDGNLVGSVEVKITEKGRLSGKIVGLSERYNVSAKNWTAGSDGVVSTTASVRGGNVVFNLGTDGFLRGSMTSASTLGNPVSLMFGAFPWGADHSATPFAGYYVMSLVAGEEVQASGNGYMTLTVAASSARTGKASFKGVLPNGQTVSGSATLLASADGRTAYLPLMKKASSDVVASLIALPARSTGGNARAVNGSAVRWRHEDRAAAASFECHMRAYGGVYNANEDFARRCIAQYGVANLPFDIGVDALTGKTSFGGSAIAPVAHVTASASALSIDSSQVRFSFKRNTGVYSGSFKLMLGGKAVNAKFAGVVVPAGSGEGLPFGMGACWFADRVSGVAVKSGCRVNIGMGEADR